MSSHERFPAARSWVRLGAVCALAALTAGCFQPLYGQRSADGNPALGQALAAVEVLPIEAPPASPLSRLAVEVRNELTYALNHGNQSPPPTHRLKIALRAANSSLIVDPRTARAEFETVNLDATYLLTEIETNKVVVNGAAKATTSYDIPGQQQRYTRLRGQRDAQSNAARTIAEQIRNRLASYMAAGT